MFADFSRQELLARDRLQRLHDEARLSRLLKQLKSEGKRPGFWQLLRRRAVRPASA